MASRISEFPGQKQGACFHLDQEKTALGVLVLHCCCVTLYECQRSPGISVPIHPKRWREGLRGDFWATSVSSN